LIVVKICRLLVDLHLEIEFRRFSYDRISNGAREDDRAKVDAHFAIRCSRDEGQATMTTKGTGNQSSSSREELLAEVERHTWLYSVDLGDGIYTNGLFGPPHTLIGDALDKIEIQGKRVLDVGCWEGQWSFEVERRGAAKVYATDYLVGDPRAEISESGLKELPTFRLAHKILNSKVNYHPDVSVYQIDKLGVRDFDVILFCGVYYHLKNPLLALAKLRQMMKVGGLIIVEGAVVDGAEASARFYYHEVLGDDASNWWVPTVPCLRQWIECSFLEPIDEYGPVYHSTRFITLFPGKRAIGSSPTTDTDNAESEGRTETIGRYVFTAKAVSRTDRKYVLPDEDLIQYDVNT
jgi:tRNA (mo5U34)-methyltransferase